MKNKTFVFKSQMDQVIRNKWKTDFFKNLQDKEGSVINLLVKRLKNKNFYFYDYSEPFEKHHMMLWFYHIGNREYENPFIHDLYLFHEYYHLISFPEKRFYDFNEWKEAMWINELEASLMSEVYIYYFEPELRSKTFKQNIWFDDIKELFGYEKINVDDNVLMFKNHPEIFKSIKTRREAIRNGAEPLFESEKWIAGFNNKDDWFKCWEPFFDKVEDIRNEFENLTKINDFYASIKLNEALEKNSKKEIPFYEVALMAENKLGD